MSIFRFLAYLAEVSPRIFPFLNAFKRYFSLLPNRFLVARLDSALLAFCPRSALFSIFFAAPHVLSALYEFCVAQLAQHTGPHHETHCPTYAVDSIPQNNKDGRNVVILGHKALQMVRTLSCGLGRCNVSVGGKA